MAEVDRFWSSGAIGNCSYALPCPALENDQAHSVGRARAANWAIWPQVGNFVGARTEQYRFPAPYFMSSRARNLASWSTSNLEEMSDGPIAALGNCTNSPYVERGVAALSGPGPAPRSIGGPNLDSLTQPR